MTSKRLKAPDISHSNNRRYLSINIHQSIMWSIVFLCVEINDLRNLGISVSFKLISQPKSCITLILSRGVVNIETKLAGCPNGAFLYVLCESVMIIISFM